MLDDEEDEKEPDDVCFREFWLVCGSGACAVGGVKGESVADNHCDKSSSSETFLTDEEGKFFGSAAMGVRISSKQRKNISHPATTASLAWKDWCLGGDGFDERIW